MNAKPPAPQRAGLTVADYPLAEKRPDLVTTAQGTGIGELTLEAIEAGEIDMANLRITPEALQMQAEIAESAGRPKLAENFRRAADLVNIPQDILLQVYDLLRPGRAKSKAELHAAADRLRREYDADRIAAFIEEAAEIYERRSLFTYRF